MMLVYMTGGWLAVAFELLYIGHVLGCIQGTCSPYIIVIILC